MSALREGIHIHTHTHTHRHRQTHTHTQFMIFYRLHANTPRLPEHSFILSLFLFHTLHSLVRSAATVLQQQSVWQTWLLLCIVALPADRLCHSGSELNAGSLCTPPPIHTVSPPSPPPAPIHHPVQPQRIYSSPITLSLSSPPENNHTDWSELVGWAALGPRGAVYNTLQTGVCHLSSLAESIGGIEVNYDMTKELRIITMILAG